MPKTSAARSAQPYTQNRELSWLRFNQRVLEEARDETVPLLERMKFVAIFTSNLDEFFMIRVGSLYALAELGENARDSKTDMTYAQQLEVIYDAVAPLYKERDKTYTEIKKQLYNYGVYGLDMKELTDAEKKYIRKYFKDQVLPVLSPQIVDPSHPFPHLLNKEIYVIVELMKKNPQLTNRSGLSSGTEVELSKYAGIGIVPVPTFISDIIYLPGDEIRYVRIEKIIMEYIHMVFEQFHVSNPNYICVTRNADVDPQDEAFAEDDDFRKIMQKTLHKRRRMAVVRLEVASPLKKELEKYFCKKFNITSRNIYRTKMPMKLDYMFVIGDKVPPTLKEKLTDAPYIPQPSPYISDGAILPQVKRRDILLSYPYESMEPFLRMIREASKDPDVMTLKVTIYRLGNKSRLVEYLCAAAENGKDVTVLIELRARFDEQNNIHWSQRLEEAGCTVLYGMEEFKVHSKLCLITYRYRNEIRYITQVGTGNYNEKTAKLYTDYSLITANQEIGMDASNFFKYMALGQIEGVYQHFLVAPLGLKPGIFAKIDEEIAKGSDGRILMKMNSLTDIDYIEKLSEASNAGVSVQLIVRGICCILPGIPEFTENITVTSVVGRYLEHPRLYIFGKDEHMSTYIGSADMMTRNTEKRVEVTCPILDSEIVQRLYQDICIILNDNVKARRMNAEGRYKRIKNEEPKLDSQQFFMERAMQAVKMEDMNHPVTMKDRLRMLLSRLRK